MNNINPLSEETLALYVLETAYEKIMREKLSVENPGVVIKEPHLFPKWWLSNTDFETKKQLLMKAIEEKKLIRELCEFSDDYSVSR